MHLRTIFNERDVERLLQRVDRLDPDAPRRWGRMNAHQAVCHLVKEDKDGPASPDGSGAGRWPVGCGVCVAE